MQTQIQSALERSQRLLVLPRINLLPHQLGLNSLPFVVFTCLLDLEKSAFLMCTNIGGMLPSLNLRL